MADQPRIPKPTARRLSLYLRELESLLEQGKSTINSTGLGAALDLTDAQVRKDLATFGQFGRPGVGYDITALRAELRRIMGTDRQWNVVVVGAGNIGTAVTRYPRFGDRGFRVVAVFDADPAVVGNTVAGHQVLPVSDIQSRLPGMNISLAIIAVPAEGAQQVADMLVAAGISGILNFAPVYLSVPGGVAVSSVDLARSLEQLAFEISADLA